MMTPVDDSGSGMETPWSNWLLESEMMNDPGSFLHQWENMTPCENQEYVAPVLASAAAGVGFNMMSTSLSSESHDYSHAFHPVQPVGCSSPKAAGLVAGTISKKSTQESISWNFSSAAGKSSDPAEDSYSPPAAPFVLSVPEYRLSAIPASAANIPMPKAKEELMAASTLPSGSEQKRETLLLQQRAAQDHILAERNRREKINKNFIALSAIIPGLKKADKASVLGDAVKYVKELEERVRALEDQNMSRTVESVVLINKAVVVCAGDDDTLSSSDEHKYERQTCQEPFPEIEAKVCGKTALLRIHCHNRKGVLVKILSEIESMNLTVININAMPFLASSSNITVTAQMEDELPVTVSEIARKLKSALT